MKRSMKNTCRTRVESEVSKEHVLKPQQTRYTRRKATASSPPKVTPGNSRTTLHRDTETHAGNLNPDSFNFIIFAPSIGEHPSSILEISSNRGATTHTIKASISFSRSPHPPSTPEPFTRRTSLESVLRLIRRHQGTTYRNLERKQNPMVLLQKPAKQSLGSLHSPESKAGDDGAMEAFPSRSLIFDQMKNKRRMDPVTSIPFTEDMHKKEIKLETKQSRTDGGYGSPRRRP
ncbi:hypothetical protein HID58_050112 [Brassica napus]|uniref:Uncharacterized protein n=2 Tax=Brassica napus TaxID=3708 RepID=A0ABQ8A5L2_BRANA|nr:hypothetical protein HID58_050112 [Brassica napus]